MALGLLAGVAAAVAFGVAALLQAVSAQRERPVTNLDPLLVVRLLRHPAFVLAIVLNLSGFVLHVVALRELPLFLAQAVTSASVVVTALLSTRVLGVRLQRSGVLAVAAVCLGLVLLAAAAAGTGSVEPSTQARLGLLGSVGVLALGGALVAHVPGPPGAALLGVAAGLGFSVVAVASRVLPDLSPSALLVEPAAYAVVLAGPLSFLLYSTGLQRAGVLTATSAVLVVQNVAPAAAGVLALGDTLREGGLPLAAVGLALAVAGVAALTRFDPHALVEERRRTGQVRRAAEAGVGPGADAPRGGP